MKRYIKSLMTVGVFSLALVNTGCIEETEPTAYATTEQIERSSSATEALLMAQPAYFNHLWDDDYHYSFGYGAIMKVRDVQSGDFCFNQTSYNHFSNWERNRYQGDGWAIGQFIWNYYWGFVLTANNMVGGVNPETATDEQLGYLGVGHAFRAMIYLDMARCYEFLPNDKTSNVNVNGNDVLHLTIPIVTDTTSMENATNNPRATREQMAAFIQKDLDKAEELIVNLGSTRGKVLPDLSCVYGLKARLYMWLENYPEAQKYARLAIDNASVNPMTKSDCLNKTTGFNVVDPWMWGAQQTSEDEVVQSGIINWTSWSSNELTFGYNGLGTGLYSLIDRAMYDRISNTDFRKLWFKAPEGSPLEDKSLYLIPEQATFDEESSYYMPAYASRKFRPGNGNPDDYVTGSATAYPIMRVEEMYFIEAEAAAHQDASQGAALVNNFMTTYRDPNYNVKYNSQDELIEEIVFQKRVELWGEGQSFFDIKRLNLSVTRGYEGTNHYSEARLNTTGRPAWMNYVMVRTEANNNKAVNGWNNPDPSDLYDVWSED